MTKNRLLLIFVGIFSISDFTFSFIQYYNTPLFGDLASHVLPDEIIQPVFDDPFGFNMLLAGEKHSNPNRFFSHFFLSEYFQHVPFWLQKFTNPVNSVYLASALAKITVQVLFVFLMAAFVSGKRNPFNRKFLFSAVLVAPLFQVYGFWSRMGIVDKSVVYTFFYGIPLVLLMLFFLPVFNRMLRNKKIRMANWIFLLPLIVILPLSGPLVPAVILIVSFLIFINYWVHAESKRPSDFLKYVPDEIYVLLIPICVWSLYSLFLGFYNSNYDSEMISLWERFKRLPKGVYSQLFHSLGFPLMLMMIGVNIIFMKKKHSPESRKLVRILIWIGIFAFIYILFLPFGGYRPYRPRIIRYDTFMPVNITLIWFFAASCWFLLNHLKGKKKKQYMAGLIFVLLIFIVADLDGIGENKCERNAFEKMAHSKESIVAIPKDCHIMDWYNVYDYNQTESKAELIYYWGITDHKKLFYNEQ
jgi:hypothetical protein